MKKYLAMLIAVVCLFSCEENLQDATSEISKIDLSQGEMAFTDQAGETTEAYYRGEKVTLEVIDGTYVLGGDIIIPESQLVFVEPPQVAAGLQTESVGRTAGRWPNNTVYYTVNSSLPNKSRVTDAIAEWEAKTNLRFVQRTNQSDYIEFRSGSGCSSSVGRVGGRQFINLASGCSTGNNIHEIGHAIGLYHEHTRADRDTYVTVNFGNIQSGRQNNFQTYIQRGTDGQDYTNTLDFGSIMMYSSFAFSNNGQPTITKKDGSTFTTQRNALSS
ncbi:MAG: M12 family metallopeptidase, partial [Bacteroidota bacterium]